MEHRSSIIAFWLPEVEKQVALVAQSSGDCVVLIGACVNLVLVALLWGCTNPFLRKGNRKISTVTTSSIVPKFLYEVVFLATNWKFLLPFLINQSGSLIYFFTLADTDLSFAVPVANSLTFVFTALAGAALGEELPNKGTCAGMLLIVFGIILCIFDKMTYSSVT